HRRVAGGCIRDRVLSGSGRWKSPPLDPRRRLLLQLDLPGNANAAAADLHLVCPATALADVCRELVQAVPRCLIPPLVERGGIYVRDHPSRAPVGRSGTGARRASRGDAEAANA